MDYPEILAIAAAFLAGLAAAYFWFRTRVALAEGRARNELDRWKNEHEDAIRKDSVSRSRSTLKGRISEQMAPLLPGFPYHPADARFIGNPVDFVIFDGYTAAQDGRVAGDGNDSRGRETCPPGISIVIVEVKRGKGRLTRGETLVKQAVEEGRVSWQTIVIPDPAED